MTVVHVPVPLQPPPLHPTNTEDGAALAVKVTELAVGNGALHVAPQLIPAGLLVTVPDPVPAFVTVSVEVVTVRLKVAVTVRLLFILTTQVPFPLHPLPLQPAKVEPAAAVAVRVTVAVVAKSALQVAPQLIPAGLLVTVPDPAPDLLTVSVDVLTVPVNVAVTV
jgi:hypothetical protein